jgi:hypothetical protein
MAEYKKYNKVFISYASEDIETANMLHDYLQTQNFETWLDKKNLLAGQDWDNEIRNALKNADFIILLLSDVSVEKRGYIQKEYKLALQFCEEKLESDIYIIPCKINDCSVPSNLCKYQWVELYNQKGDKFANILQSLCFQQQKYKNKNKLITMNKKPSEYKEIEIKETVNEVLPKTNIDITYPQFTNTENIDLKILNSFIENIIFPVYNNFRAMSCRDIFKDEVINNLGMSEEEGELFNLDNELKITYKFNLLSESMISFEIWEYIYHSGAAHGYSGIVGYNFILNPLKEINNIEQLFDNNKVALEKLHTICLEKLKDHAIEREIISNREDTFLLDYPLEWQTFHNFYFTKESIVFIFNPYEISCYAHGHLFAEIKFSDISNLFSNIKTLNMIVSIIMAKYIYQK